MKIKSLLFGLPAIILSSMTFASCEPKEGETDTLSVEPSDAIVFQASDNEDVRLTVTTTAKDWEYTAPE